MVVKRWSPLIADSSESSTKPTRSEECLERKERVAIGLSSPIMSPTQQPFGQSGQILAQTTASSKLLRRWHECSWVHLKPASLLVFRSRNDFEKWVTDAGGDIARRRKDRSILLAVDFDTLGILASNGERGLNTNSLLSNSKGSSAKLVSKLHKYALGDVTSTISGTAPLFSFKLERYSNVGVDTVGSFASADPDRLRSFRKVIHECIQITTRPKRKEAEAKKCPCRTDEDTHTHTSTVAHSYGTYSPGRATRDLVRRRSPVACS